MRAATSPRPRPSLARIPAAPLPPPRESSRETRIAIATWAVVLTIGVTGFGPMPRLHTATPVLAADVTAVPPAQQTVVASPTAATTTTTAPLVPAGVMQPATFTTDLPDGRAAVAVATAMAQIGLPYVWGGDGPTNGEAGFDCSGLTTFSYAAAGVRLPRTAHTQYYAGSHVPAGAPLQPGDLVFYGTPAFVHHVGMYIGAGRMVNAPTFGKPVQTAYYRWNGDDYLGATRPAASGTGTPGLLLTVPPSAPAPSMPQAQVFAAPPAPLPPTPLPSPTTPQPSEAATAAAARTATEPAPVTSVVTPLPTTSAVPTTTAPTEAAAPTTTVAPTTTPPPTTTPTTAPATTTSPTPATTEPQPEPTTVTVAGTTVPVAAVVAGADRLPSAVGLWSRTGRPVLRLTAAVAGNAAPGSTITIKRPEAAAVNYVVQSTITATTAEAAAMVAGAPAGTLVVAVSTGPDTWMVLEGA
jgi:cell wall-associated NlpC family hydrolase